MELMGIATVVIACISLLPYSSAAISARRVEARTFCPSDFTLLQGHCYYFSQEVMNNWDEAWRLCQELDPRAVLVNIETLREWKILKTYLVEEKLAAKNWWIGGSDRESEGQWTWVGANQPFSYSDWCRLQPDNAKDNENCAHIRNDNNYLCWNDLHCTHDTFGYKLNFICEI